MVERLLAVPGVDATAQNIKAIVYATKR